MKQEIKFRGKRIDNETWEYGSLVILNGRYFIFNDECRVEVVPSTVGQYTGLKDKNGREIYEGDIFQAGYFGGTDVVIWDNKNARYIGRSPQGCISYVGREPAVEVLGNTHDTPELLKTVRHE